MVHSDHEREEDRDLLGRLSEEPQEEVIHPKATLNDIITNEDGYDFTTFMLWDQKPMIQVEKAYRPTGGTISTKQYLDYLLVVSKELDLRVLKDSPENPKKLRIYPKAYQRYFPNKFFSKFPLGSHTYFFGKYEDLDVYILFRPLALNGTCNCSLNDGSVSEAVAEIFLREVILKALTKYQFLTRIPTDVLGGRNVTISNDYENFTSFQSTEFFLKDFNDGFYDDFKNLWNSLGYAFCASHVPQLCFVQFGQNMLLEETTDLYAFTTYQFDQSKIQYMQYSVATNLLYTAPATPDNVVDNPQNPLPNDPFVRHILVGQVPETPVSLLITKNAVETICESCTNFSTFSKCFNPGFSNFRSIGLPAQFENVITNNIKALGLLGYSTAANVLRRTSKSEPFTSRPVANIFQSRTPTDKTKFRAIMNENIEDLIGSVGNMIGTGVGYRLEITYEIEPGNWDIIATEMGQNLLQVQAICSNLMLKHGILVPTTVFPQAVMTLGGQIFSQIDSIVKRFEEQPGSVKVCEKELAVLLENLVFIV
jgi:hypothetical protein